MTKDNVIKAIRNVARYLGYGEEYNILIVQVHLPELLNKIILDYLYRVGFKIEDDFIKDDVNIILEAFRTLQQKGHFNFDENDK